MQQTKQKKSTPEQLEYDVRSCSFESRTDTVNIAARTVDAVIATEARVDIYDRGRRQVVEEILLMRGYLDPIATVPLLDNHFRFSLDDVFGSSRGIEVKGTELHARLHFADLTEITSDDPEARRLERAWLKVQQGHQRQVSLGYEVHEATYVEPGSSKTIAGRKFTAGDRPLRIATRWRPKEVSLTPIAADIHSSTRSEIMKPDNQPEQVADEISSAQEVRSESIAETEVVETRAAEPVESVDVMDTIRNERARVNAINQLFAENKIDNAAAQQKAIDEGWSAERASHDIVLPAIRNQRPNAVDNGQAPAGHVRGSEDITTDALICAMALRDGGTAGIGLDHNVWGHRSMAASECSELRGSAMRQDINNDERQKAMEVAHRLGHVSMQDMARFALQAAGKQVSVNNETNIRSAMSGGDLLPIFTSNVHARMMASFVEADDTTVGWCASDDVPNFKLNDRTTASKSGGLKKIGRGGVAEHTDFEATTESFRIARYGDKFTVDEQDFIDDSFGALNAVMPEDMGAAAGQLRPDLVYSLLLANPNLDATGGALFAASRNLFTGLSMDKASLESLITNMANQRDNNRPINAKLRYLILPPDLYFKALVLINSADTADANNIGTMNSLKSQGITVISESRIGTEGVFDPDAEVQRTGSATSWYTAGQPGQNNAQTCLVAYRSGTMRSPQIRSYTLSQGQWGMGWDVAMDIGAKPLHWRFLQKATA